METKTDYLIDGGLPGWPGRFSPMLTTGGSQLLCFKPGEDEVIKITETYSTVLPAQKRFNHLLGKGEKGGYKGNLQNYYPEFLYNVLREAQARIIATIHGEQEGHYQSLLDSYVRFRNCTQGKGEKNFAQSKNSL